MSLIVKVTTVAGRHLELELPPARASVAAVKEAIAKQWDVPPLCQLLVRDTQVLQDSHSLVEGGSMEVDQLDLTLIVSLEGLWSTLCDGDSVARLVSLEAAGSLATAGDERALEAISACLEDEEVEVRQAALKKLRTLADRGDELVLAAGLRLLGHWDEDVRRTATRVLTEFAPRGDPAVLAALTTGLQDYDEEVRREVVRALSEVAERGSGPAVEALSSCLQDAPRVKWLAESAICTLAEEGGERLIAEAAARMTSHQHEEHRLRALRTLVVLADKFPKQVLAVLHAHLAHRSAAVRQLAIGGLRTLRQQGRAPANLFDLLVPCLKDPDAGVRQATADSLRIIAEKGDEQVIAALADCLKDEAPLVREAALEALAAVASKGDGRALAAIGTRLEDEDENVQWAAMEALGSLAQESDEHVISALRARLTEETTQRLRGAATRALRACTGSKAGCVQLAPIAMPMVQCAC